MTTGRNASPPLFAADQILELEGANRLLDQLLPHVNQHEIHRELGSTPNAAKAQALAEKRSVLRPAPSCPWWPFVWSQHSRVRVGDDGKVPAAPNVRPLPPRRVPPSSVVSAPTATSIRGCYESFCNLL